MGTFGIYAVVLTFGLILYYAVAIALDLFKKDGKKKDAAESFDVSDMNDGGMSTKVDELADGGFALRDGSQPIESAPLDEEPEAESAPETSTPVSEGEESSPSDDDTEDADDDRSLYEQAEASVEDMESLDVEYQQVLESPEMLAELERPLSQKSNIFREIVMMADEI